MHKKREFQQKARTFEIGDNLNFNDVEFSPGDICKICDRKFLIYKTHNEFKMTTKALKQDLENNEVLAEQEFEDYSIARKQFVKIKKEADEKT